MKNTLYRWRLSSGIALIYATEDFARKVGAIKATDGDETKMRMNRSKWLVCPNFTILKSAV